MLFSFSEEKRKICKQKKKPYTGIDFRPWKEDNKDDISVKNNRSKGAAGKKE